MGPVGLADVGGSECFREPVQVWGGGTSRRISTLRTGMSAPRGAAGRGRGGYTRRVMSAFLDWQEAYEAGAGVCGGKGYNLARLARYGFRVPRGGVLVAGASLDEIEEGVARTGLAEAAVAVRSSATGEDSARASFAGIHRSVLQVRGAAARREAARVCVDSLQTAEAIAYRRRMGFTDDEVRCAVVICEMVEAVSAGVAFSCDPASGRRDRIVIDAAAGLGEAVVSGRVNPLRMAWRSGGGRLRREGGAANPAWLPARIEEELAHQVLRIHWALGEGQDPQDVEWAYDGEQLWILQARPVTRVPRAGYRETAGMPRYWSTGNIKDAVPGVVCEFSWNALTDVVGDAAYASLKAAGCAMPEGMEVVRRFHGRGYFDLTLMQWAFFDGFGLAPAEVVKVIGGHQPEIEVPAGRRGQMAGLQLVRQIWNYPERAREPMERLFAYVRGLEDTDWRGLSRAELGAAVERQVEWQNGFVPVFGLASSCSGPWKLALEETVKDASLIARLQAGGGGVASAEQGYRLSEIAQGKSTVGEFLREFGHRTVYEADLWNARWVEEPAWIEEQVEALRRNPPAKDPRAAAEEVRREAERELRERFGWRAPLLLWVARKLREAMAVREGAKSALVALMLPARRIVLEIGRRLVEEGKLDAPEQALHFAQSDLKAWLRGEWDGAGARELAEDRAARRARWLAEEAPDLITEAPDGRMASSTGDAETGLDGSGGWSGISVSPGRVSGRARIVMTPHDAGHLEQGDILIAPSTDPGWTPLFLRASGIVMETGGYLSHGAIVAREFGIPAIANVPGILKALRDGERVTVDATNGRIVREA